MGWRIEKKEPTLITCDGCKKTERILDWYEVVQYSTYKEVPSQNDSGKEFVLCLKCVERIIGE